MQIYVKKAHLFSKASSCPAYSQTAMKRPENIAARGRCALRVGSNAAPQLILLLGKPVRCAAKRAAMRIAAVKNTVAVGILR
jgi:hypothetical protein